MWLREGSTADGCQRSISLGYAAVLRSRRSFKLNKYSSTHRILIAATILKEALPDIFEISTNPMGLFSVVTFFMYHKQS